MVLVVNFINFVFRCFRRFQYFRYFLHSGIFCIPAFSAFRHFRHSGIFGIRHFRHSAIFGTFCIPPFSAFRHFRHSGSGVWCSGCWFRLRLQCFLCLAPKFLYSPAPVFPSRPCLIVRSQVPVRNCLVVTFRNTCSHNTRSFTASNLRLPIKSTPHSLSQTHQGICVRPQN